MGDENSYVIENIYQGGYSSLAPNYGSLFTNYRTDTGSIGVSTDARTANILKEVSDKIAPGEKVVELSLIQPEIFEAIPKQHLKEINRLSKLTGVDITVHGPLVEPSGVSQQGFSESSRELAERQMLHAVERSHEVNPDGNVPVTFHTSSGIPGAEYKRLPEGEKISRLPIINQETGQISSLKEEKKYYPGKGEEKRSPEEELRVLNDTEWLNGLTGIEQYRKEADEIISGALIPLAPVLKKYEAGEQIELSPEQKKAFQQIQRAEVFLSNVEASFNSMYNRAYKYSDDLSKNKLNEISNEWKKGNEMMKEEGNALNYPFLKSQLLEKAMARMRDVSAPEVHTPIEDFAMNKSVESFGNVAFESYKKFKDNSPIINIENPPAGFGLSRGEDLKNMVEKSREQFVERAMQEGMGKSEAEREAEKLIGVTWDVGHINQLRKFGFSGKDIVKEAEKIAPLVKHIHLSDNFGMENVELPIGMGNVDLKEVMEKLGEKGEKAKKIVEAAHWWQHQQTSPMGATFEALGGPIYSTGEAPYWNQALGFQQGYFGGYGQILPLVNYETFGAGFSNLPTELGGQRQGRSRMGGNPME